MEIIDRRCCVVLLIAARRVRQREVQPARHRHRADRQGLTEDLASVVTASGEVKPRNYINIGAEYPGQLTDILVKEGDHVRKGQLLARIDEAQSQADVAAQKAALSSAEADAAASEAGATKPARTTSPLSKPP